MRYWCLTQYIARFVFAFASYNAEAVPVKVDRANANAAAERVCTNMISRRGSKKKDYSYASNDGDLY